MDNYWNMQNHNAHGNVLQMYQTPEMLMPQPYGMMTQSSNRYIYLRQSSYQTVASNSVIHVNPHFNKKKVFVNPNFQSSNNLVSTIPKIHINPNVQNMNFASNKIHVNPNILKTGSSIDLPHCVKTVKSNSPQEKKELKPTVYSSRTKLIRASEKIVNLSPDPKKVKTVINTKYKMVKSQVENKKLKMPTSKYKLVSYKISPEKKKIINKFKLDNRVRRTIHSIPLQPKNIISKHKLIRVARDDRQSKSPSHGLYKKAPNILQKSPTVRKLRRTSILNNTICKSKYKIVKSGSIKSRLSIISMNILHNKIIKSPKHKLRVLKNKKVISPGKLRKCNIPCPYFRKFGKCKGYDNAKCFRKHDPDQIALCTKFLQGACINEKCLLSHNVSPEKMPTCKFYLEGTCSKDQCPYLHVRLSSKADICKDFLEGFCRKGAECDKRHQYLCPEYEKTGNCLKQRCPYPHGKMVRKYSVIDKYKFAKKCSENENLLNKETSLNNQYIDVSDKSDVRTDNIKEAFKSRYYVNQTVEDCSNTSKSIGKTPDENISDTAVCIRTRPKLGSLPSFIAFEET